MPLPAFLVAKVVAKSTSIITVASGVAGGVATGVATAYYFLFPGNKPKPTEEEIFFEMQEGMLINRITTVEKSIKEVDETLHEVFHAYTEVICATGHATQAVSMLTHELKSKTELFKSVEEHVVQSNTNLPARLNQINELGEHVVHHTVESKMHAQEFQAQLEEKNQIIVHLQEDVSTLNQTLMSKEKSISTLNKHLITLSDINETQKVRINEQDAQINQLVPQVKRLTEQNRFFKQVLQHPLGDTKSSNTNTQAPSL